MSIIIYHNPQCGTSRNVLEIIKSTGVEPVVVEYLQSGWSGEQLRRLFAAAGLTARMALRSTGTPAAQLGLLDSEVSEEKILQAMIEHPILVNRPFVETPKGVLLCRPSEKVLALLDLPQGWQFRKEDGEILHPPQFGNQP